MLAQQVEQARARPDVGLAPLAVHVRPDEHQAAARSASAHPSARRAITRDGVPPVGAGPADVVDRVRGLRDELAEAFDRVRTERRPRVVPQAGVLERLRRKGLGGLGTHDGRRDRTERHPHRPTVLVDLQAQVRDRDHHRVPRPDLREGAGATRHVPPRAQDQLARLASGLLHAGQVLAPRHRTRRPAGPREDRPRRPTPRAPGARPRPASRSRGCRPRSRGCGSAATPPTATPARARCARAARA